MPKLHTYKIIYEKYDLDEDDEPVKVLNLVNAVSAKAAMKKIQGSSDFNIIIDISKIE